MWEKAPGIEIEMDPPVTGSQPLCTEVLRPKGRGQELCSKPEV